MAGLYAARDAPREDGSGTHEDAQQVATYVSQVPWKCANSSATVQADGDWAKLFGPMARRKQASPLDEAMNDFADRLTRAVLTAIDIRTRVLVRESLQQGPKGHLLPPLTARAPVAVAVRRNARTGSMIPLPQAEREFRTRYLRTLLAETQNRQEAARQAGVPYRTLCDMILKVGLA
jgi:hypothetical protein